MLQLIFPETVHSRSPGHEDPAEWDRAGCIDCDKSSHYKSAGNSDGVTVFSGCWGEINELQGS